MRKHRTFRVAVILLGALALVIQASASTHSECQSLIKNLKITIRGIDFIGPNPEKIEAYLTSILDSASLYLDQGKTEEAIIRMQDFKDKVIRLERNIKPSIPADAAEKLLLGADWVMDCMCELIQDDLEKPAACFAS